MKREKTPCACNSGNRDTFVFVDLIQNTNGVKITLPKLNLFKVYVNLHQKSDF